MEETRVLLLHGVGHVRPEGHWLWWLAEQLRAARVPVQYPQFPDPDDPDPAAWADLARAELGMLTAGGGHTVVIAHSLGTILWSHLAETLPAHLLPARVALVAPPARAEWAVAAPKFAELRLGALDGAPTVIVGRQEDPYRPAPLAELAGQWGVPFVEIPGVGHLTPDDGHGPFPGALAWVLGGPDASWVDAGVAGSKGL
ncbi:MAG: hydrolase [Demequinaceae bacterium]|nr:hydrolase [Demequinaceae bacterium]